MAIVRNLTEGLPKMRFLIAALIIYCSGFAANAQLDPTRIWGLYNGRCVAEGSEGPSCQDREREAASLRRQGYCFVGGYWKDPRDCPRQQAAPTVAPTPATPRIERSQPAEPARPAPRAQPPAPPPLANTQTARPDAQIERWFALNNVCRGTAGAEGEKACMERETVAAALDKSGWCYGRKDQTAVDYRWHFCDQGSLLGNATASNSAPQHKTSPPSAESPAPPKSERSDPLFPLRVLFNRTSRNSGIQRGLDGNLIIDRKVAKGQFCVDRTILQRASEDRVFDHFLHEQIQRILPSAERHHYTACSAMNGSDRTAIILIVSNTVDADRSGLAKVRSDELTRLSSAEFGKFAKTVNENEAKANANAQEVASLFDRSEPDAHAMLTVGGVNSKSICLVSSALSDTQFVFRAKIAPQLAAQFQTESPSTKERVFLQLKNGACAAGYGTVADMRAIHDGLKREGKNVRIDAVVSASDIAAMIKTEKQRAADAIRHREEEALERIKQEKAEKARIEEAQRLSIEIKNKKFAEEENARITTISKDKNSAIIAEKQARQLLLRNNSLSFFSAKLSSFPKYFVFDFQAFYHAGISVCGNQFLEGAARLKMQADFVLNISKNVNIESSNWIKSNQSHFEAIWKDNGCSRPVIEKTESVAYEAFKNLCDGSTECKTHIETYNISKNKSHSQNKIESPYNLLDQKKECLLAMTAYISNYNAHHEVQLGENIRKLCY